MVRFSQVVTMIAITQNNIFPSLSTGKRALGANAQREIPKVIGSYLYVISN